MYHERDMLTFDDAPEEEGGREITHITYRMTPYDRALAHAAAEGTRAGQNAAGWYVMDTLGGRVTGDVRPAARAILRGIEDGDPAVMDTLPYPDLSGQWADTLTGPQLVTDALMAAGYAGAYATQWRDAGMDWLAPLCDAYESAFSTAVESAISTAAREVLA
jgi:hypothetical protein